MGERIGSTPSGSAPSQSGPTIAKLAASVPDVRLPGAAKVVIPWKGWILYKEDPAIVKQETYEINRLIETGAKFDVEVELVNPDHVDGLYLTDGRSSRSLVDSRCGRAPDYARASG